MPTAREIADRANAWIVGRDTGMSSQAMWAVMMGVETDGSSPHPRDAADLGRCIRLLEAVPEWRPRLKEMALVNGYWAALVAHWDELEALYAEGDWAAVYRRMGQILAPIEAKDRSVVNLGGGASVRFGRP